MFSCPLNIFRYMRYMNINIFSISKISSVFMTHVTLEHETSHKVNSVKLRLILINHISIDVWFGQYLGIWNLRVQKHLNIEKIIFKVVQITFLAMHINNQ